MKQIKTLTYVAGSAGSYDKAVNAAIAEGWELKRRGIISHNGPDRGPLLYAELERDIITEAERCCENCKYYDKKAEEEPCLSCGINANKWEEGE